MGWNDNFEELVETMTLMIHYEFSPKRPEHPSFGKKFVACSRNIDGVFKLREVGGDKKLDVSAKNLVEQFDVTPRTTTQAGSQEEA